MELASSSAPVWLAHRDPFSYQLRTVIAEAPAVRAAIGALALVLREALKSEISRQFGTQWGIPGSPVSRDIECGQVLRVATDLRPGSNARIDIPVSQEKFIKVLTRFGQRPCRRRASSHQVAHCFMAGVWSPNFVQLAGAVQSSCPAGSPNREGATNDEIA